MPQKLPETWPFPKGCVPPLPNLVKTKVELLVLAVSWHLYKDPSGGSCAVPPRAPLQRVKDRPQTLKVLPLSIIFRNCLGEENHLV